MLLLILLPCCNREEHDYIADWIYNEDIVNCVAINSNGGIIVAGNTSNNHDIVVMQFNPDGSVDNNFGNSGKTVLNISDRDNVNSIVIYDDDKFDLLTTYEIYGSEYYNLVRFLPDGNIDHAFGNGGMALSMAGAMVSMVKNSNHSIIVGGTSNQIPGQANTDFIVAQYFSTGAPDDNFNSGSTLSIDFGYMADKGTGIAIQADDKILISGYLINCYPVFDFGMARINPDGSLDTAFGTNGMVITDIDDSRDYARCMEIQPDGKILVCGKTGKQALIDDLALVRYDQDGSPDQNFGIGGIVLINAINSNNNCCKICLQQDGKIILAGSSDKSYFNDNDTSKCDFMLIRLNVDGSIDNNFGNNGLVTTDIKGHKDYAHSAVIKPDGKIVVVGKTTIAESDEYTNIVFAIVSYNSDGSPDSTFGENGIVTADF